MRPVRRASIAVAALLGSLIAASFVPAAAVAKEFMSAEFDAPIGMDTPAGTELLVGVTVRVLTDDGEMPVQGSPIVLVLTGKDGSTTEGWGINDLQGSIGHYSIRIAVPGGGARDARLVMRGTGPEGVADIEILKRNEALTFGGITATTAQEVEAPAPSALAVVPPSPATDPASVDAGAQAAQAQEAAPDPATTTSPVSGLVAWPAALGMLVLGLAVVVVVRVRAGRRATREP